MDNSLLAVRDINHKYIVVDENSETYGYRVYVPKTDLGAHVYSGGVLAQYDCELTAIDDIGLKNRIIVVGSIGHNIVDNSISYYYAPSSNIGSRVDVCAPGVDIVSTVPTNKDPSGYKLMEGTSMASPYVASIAAMMYQVNPSMKASQIKRYICNSGTKIVTDAHGNEYKIPDATVCYNYAKDAYEYSKNDVTLPTGILAGYVTDIDGKKISGGRITALRKSTGEYNLEDSSFSFETDNEGYYMATLPQGTYDLVIYAENYLPYSVKNVEIFPDETTYMENLVLNKWISLAYDGVSVNGKVIDAIKGTAVADATIKLRKGWNATSGAYVKTLFGNVRSTKTDENGIFTLSTHMGAYTAEISKDGYVIGYYNVVAGDNGELAALTQTTMVLTPLLSDDEYRIVLTWGSLPRDLDSHLTYYVENEKQFHVYYGNKSATYDGEKVASLDLDDVTCYGPETVTITLKRELVENGMFRYSVHNFSAGNNATSTSLSMSDATVRVYAGNTLIKTYTVPKNNIGTVWHVFDMDSNGISTTNEFYSSSAGEVQ